MFINFFVIKYFRFYLKISDFSLFFYVKTGTLPEKVHPCLSQQLPSKNWDPVNPYFFENLVEDSTPQQVGKGARTMLLLTSLPKVRGSRQQLFFKKAVLKNFAQSQENSCAKVTKQLYWNHTSPWIFSCKLAAFFQNTFRTTFLEQLWRATSACSKFLGAAMINSAFRPSEYQEFRWTWWLNVLVYSQLLYPFWSFFGNFLGSF